MNLNLTNTINLMKKYLDIPSPAGYTENAVLEIKKDFKFRLFISKVINVQIFINICQ